MGCRDTFRIDCLPRGWPPHYQRQAAAFTSEALQASFKFFLTWTYSRRTGLCGFMSSKPMQSSGRSSRKWTGSARRDTSHFSSGRKMVTFDAPGHSQTTRHRTRQTPSLKRETAPCSWKPSNPLTIFSRQSVEQQHRPDP